MNPQPNFRQQSDREDGDREIHIDAEAPIGLPGEVAPEIALAEGEGEGRDEKKPDVSRGLGGVLVNIRDAFGRKKTTRPEGHDVVDFDASESAGQSGVGARLEEREGNEAQAEAEGKASPKKKTEPRVLLGGLAAVAVVAATAGVALWPSTATRPPVSEQGMAGQQTLLAPAASLASLPKPEITSAPERPSKKFGDPLQEIMALKPQDAPLAAKDAAPTPVEEKRVRLDDGAQKPASAQAVAEKANAESPAALLDGAPGEPAGKAAVKPIVEAALQQGVAEAGVVARGQVAPVKEPALSQQEGLEAMRSQTALLERVTQLAALVAHLNLQINRLESVQTKLSTGTEEHFADLQRRMALAEASVQLDGAARAQDARHVQSLAVANPAEAKTPPARIVLKTGSPPVPAESVDDKRPYRVQAASPSLAMLGTGGNERPLEVTPGAIVPGWGRVSKIEQRGQAWVVVTAGGVIQ